MYRRRLETRDETAVDVLLNDGRKVGRLKPVNDYKSPAVIGFARYTRRTRSVFKFHLDHVRTPMVCNLS